MDVPGGSVTFMFYSKANSNRKGFQCLTEPLPVAVRDLDGSKLLHSQAFHFFGTAECAEQGCVVLTTGTEPVWLPAFYAKDASKVIDPTGGGNGFLGAFVVGYQETGSVVEAAKYGHVGASFMIEQIGCPERTGEGEDERWNGCSVSGRLADYQAMLSSHWD
ncbi:hypothetical protein EJ03DRAFT_383004 [Teratosphaeria nubilosa]|uniref:Carbohydrate kinase PfkB domain-containing protein n=1 Tax=Teratosphaeria nubilosa TaxID=161662 RepID=A0A6G1L8F5_9PEZI|nr:hypothetical protein EJ03DRAFT_383004 [Teratosphaeria nubilosa]